MSVAVIYPPTRTIKIYASAYDGTARAAIDEHTDNILNPHAVTKAQVGLGAVDNTSDANKPISTAQAAALALKAPLESPVMTGIPTAPTAPIGTVTTQLATTAFAHAAANDAIANMALDDTPLSDHLADLDNPHAVTKAQVGLGSVDNTADLAKPVSGPQQTAINVAGAAAAAAQADVDGHQAHTGNPHAVTKAQVGLGAVDNTADAAKPVSPAQQTAINAAAAIGTAAQADIDGHQSNVSNPHGVTKAQVGLGAVDNTADLAKPVSNPTQAAINAHASNLSNPHAVTKAQVGLGAVSNLAPADMPISTAQAAALALKAPLASPAMTGVPTAPTAAPGATGTQVATIGFVDAAGDALQADIDVVESAAAAAQADADAALAAAAAAQAAADAAQADATQALADAAEALAAAESPDEAIALFGETKLGEASAAVPIDPAWAATSPAGSVIRVVAAVADDPQTITPISPIPLVPGRVYDVIYRVQRIVDPLDPLNDSVTCGIQWLTNTKASNGSLTVDDIALVIANGVQQRTVRIGIAPSVTVALDYTAPAGTIYFRPFIDLYGGDAHTTDILTLDVEDVTAAAGCCGGPIQVITPASGETVTLADLRPRYVNNAAVLAALTIRLPSDAQSGTAIELGFRSSITALAIQDAIGAAVAGTPTNAYGPGSAHQYRYIDGTIGWVHWR